MSLKEQINADFLAAYKNKEMAKKNFLGVLKGSIQTNEGKQIESTDENVLKTLKSLEKGLLETISAKEKLGQSTEQERQELSYLSVYLPALMSETEVRGIVQELVSRPNINKNQGFLMGTFNKEQKGNAFDNKMVSQLIQEAIS